LEILKINQRINETCTFWLISFRTSFCVWVDAIDCIWVVKHNIYPLLGELLTSKNTTVGESEGKKTILPPETTGNPNAKEIRGVACGGVASNICCFTWNGVKSIV